MGWNEFEPRWDQEGPYWETPAGLKTYDYYEAVRLDREWANRKCLDRDINDKAQKSQPVQEMSIP